MSVDLFLFFLVRHSISHPLSLSLSLNHSIIAMLQKIDPDVLVGHNIVNTDLEVLLQRFSDLKLQNVWSRIGRLQRKKVPPSRSQQNETGFFSRISATAGRLLCDTQVSSQELVRETNYSLQNLASIYLKQSTVDIAPNLIPNYFSQTKDLIGLINHSINEAHLAFRLMNKLQILPLTKQLSCLCGNLWSQSLRSARADRVEYLLLHNFFDRNFIVPEKYTSLERRKLNSLLSTSEECEDENDSEQIVDGKRKKKPQYSGGLVLEPKKGLYDEFVLLLDFNSLYPSIIQEFDICFTTTRHWELHEGSVAEDVESIQPEKDMKGLLPKVIKGLVDRRRQVKNMLKNECDTIKKQQLDIRQKALKLVANSMYGCLGFANSRFYCKPLAARITALGRSILSKTVELVESNDYEVIYGDTDSVMVNSRTRELDSAKKIADDIKQKVNSRYTKLDIDLDNIFQRILLLRKKKYAALSLVKNTDGTITSVKELKGLDLVRRDWCPLSRELGCKVVDLLLSGESRSDVVDLIHRQMQQVESAVRNSVIPLEKFIITKCLTKAPHLYPDIKSQPHVKVALEMMKSGRQVNVGDHIPYIVCLGDGSISDRSFYPYTVIKENSDLQVDFDWYLSNQILAPISRLCEPIEGVDEARLAASLGLDSSRYKSSTSVIQGGSVGASDSENFALDVHNQNYEEAFKDAEKLMIKCSSCQNEQEFVGMQAQDGKLLHCKSEGCGHLFKDVDFHSLSNTLVLALRRHLKRFYQKIVVCDSDCDLKYGTRHLGGELGKCYMPDCPGSLSYEVSFSSS